MFKDYSGLVQDFSDLQLQGDSMEKEISKIINTKEKNPDINLH